MTTRVLDGIDSSLDRTVLSRVHSILEATNAKSTSRVTIELKVAMFTQ